MRSSHGHREIVRSIARYVLVTIKVSLSKSEDVHGICPSTGLRPFVSRPVDIVPARTSDLAKQLGPNFEEIDNDTPGSQNE